MIFVSCRQDVLCGVVLKAFKVDVSVRGPQVPVADAGPGQLGTSAAQNDIGTIGVLAIMEMQAVVPASLADGLPCSLDVGETGAVYMRSKGKDTNYTRTTREAIETALGQ